MDDGYIINIRLQVSKGSALVIDAVCNQSRKKKQQQTRKHTCHGTIMKCTHAECVFQLSILVSASLLTKRGGFEWRTSASLGSSRDRVGARVSIRLCAYKAHIDTRVPSVDLVHTCAFNVHARFGSSALIFSPPAHPAKEMR